MDPIVEVIKALVLLLFVGHLQLKENLIYHLFVIGRENRANAHMLCQTDSSDWALTKMAALGLVGDARRLFDCCCDARLPHIVRQMSP